MHSNNVGQVGRVRRGGLVVGRGGGSWTRHGAVPTGFVKGGGEDVGEAVGGGEAVDEAGDLSGELDGRTLDLADELEEGCHDAEGDDALAQAVDSPKEGGQIAGGEAYLDHGAREERTVVAPQDEAEKPVLEAVEVADGGRSSGEGPVDEAEAEVFLGEGVGGGFEAADVEGEAVESTHEGFSQQEGEGHDGDHYDGQPPIEHGHEEEGCKELHGGDKGRGGCGGGKVGEGVDIFFHALHDVGGVAAPGVGGVHGT